ncbi:MAG: flagellar motor protein MotB [Rhodospirillales bacterium]
MHVNRGARLSARRRRPLRAALLVGAFAGASALGACSQVPDAINPVSWYRGTVDFFAGDEEKGTKDGKEGLAADRGKAPPGSDKPFPNLASVDEKARARGPVAEGLGADPDRPKYAPAITRQGEAPEPPRPKPAPKPAPTPPAAQTMPPPAAAPTTPVTPAPVAPPTAAPPPAVAAAPAPIAEPTLPPITADQKEQEARLTQQLAEIRARAAVPGEVPVTAGIPLASSEGGTIVVSSEGIQTAGVSAATRTPGLTPAQAARGISGLKGALPIPGTAVKVATILFDNGSSKLKAYDKRILNAVSRLYRKSGGTIRIIGHASSRTRNLSPIRRKLANFQVSADRADQVAGELMRLGVKQENIVIAAVSDIEPMYYEFMPSGEAGNRRAEIYLEN